MLIAPVKGLWSESHLVVSRAVKYIGGREHGVRDTIPWVHGMWQTCHCMCCAYLCGYSTVQFFLLCLIEFILYLTHPGFPFWIARSQDIVEGGPLPVDVLGLLELGFEHFGRVGLREFLLYIC